MVLGAVVLGGILGSLVRVEDRLNNIGGRLQTKFGGGQVAMIGPIY